MQLPVNIAYHGVTKSETIDQLIREKAARLEKFCDHINRCDVVVEHPNSAQRSGHPYRVRIDLTVPPNHELVVDERPNEHDMHEPLQKVVNDAFKSMERQLKEVVDRQRGRVKTHDSGQTHALVSKIFRDEGYGFIAAQGGRDVYFHRNALAGFDFEQLQVGAEVRFEETAGDQGPQATTVHVVSSGSPRI